MQIYIEQFFGENQIIITVRRPFFFSYNYTVGWGRSYMDEHFPNRGINWNRMV